MVWWGIAYLLFVSSLALLNLPICVLSLSHDVIFIISIFATDDVKVVKRTGLEVTLTIYMFANELEEFFIYVFEVLIIPVNVVDIYFGWLDTEEVLLLNTI